MRGEYAPQQQGLGPAHAQDIPAKQHTAAQGDQESKQAEKRTAPEGLKEQGQINLETGQEHDVQQAHRTKQEDGRVPFQQTQSIGPQQGTGKKQHYHVRYAQFVGKQRYHQCDGDHHRKNQGGVGYRGHYNYSLFLCRTRHVRRAANFPWYHIFPIQFNPKAIIQTAFGGARQTRFRHVLFFVNAPDSWYTSYLGFIPHGLTNSRPATAGRMRDWAQGSVMLSGGYAGTDA